MKRAEPLKFSTFPHDLDGLSARLFTVVVVACQIGLLTAPFWWPVPMEPKERNSCWIVASFWMVVHAGMFLKHRLDFPRGTYRIDGKGVEFRSIRGKRRSLKWADIQVVYWPLAMYKDSYRGIILRRGRTTIRIPFETIAQPEIAAAVTFIEERLAPHFDLSERNIWFRGAIPSEQLGYRLFRAAGIGVVCFGGMILLGVVGFRFWPQYPLPTVLALPIALYIALMADRIRANWRRRQNSIPAEDLWPLE